MGGGGEGLREVVSVSFRPELLWGDFVFHMKKRRCFLLLRQARILPPLAACLTNAADSQVAA